MTMRTIEEVRWRVKVTWDRQWTHWLGDAGGDWPKTYSLDPPTEKEVQANWAGFSRWVESWRIKPDGGEVQFDTRSWSTMGMQQIPTRISFLNPVELAAFLGWQVRERYLQVEARWRDCVATWPDLADTLRSLAAAISLLEKPDYQRLIAVVDWLSEHLDSGLFLRQLPIAGVDTKWAENHAGVITKLLGVRFGRTGSLHEVAGLKVDLPRRRIRLLDQSQRSMVGGLSDLSIRLDELAKLELPVRLALVVENQQTALACQELPGTIVLMGGGFSVTELGAIPWLVRIPILYWGDIDTAGFAILNALRKHHPHTESCLMDDDTLMRYQDLWSLEPIQATGNLDALTPAEAAVRENLLTLGFKKDGPGPRLEQERIPWPDAWSFVKAKAASMLG
jgi:hypothetical protein